MTGNDIYTLALNLIGYKNADGTDNEDCYDLKNRSVSLINILLAENQKLDRSLRRDKGARIVPLLTLEDNVRCHELIAYGLLPFGLASLLIAEENAELSASLYERYLLNLKSLKETVAAVVHQISDCYRYYG